MISAIMTILTHESVRPASWSPLSSLMQCRRMSRALSCGIVQFCLLVNEPCISGLCRVLVRVSASAFLTPSADPCRRSHHSGVQCMWDKCSDHQLQQCEERTVLSFV